jgi:hypothetical protein
MSLITDEDRERIKSLTKRWSFNAVMMKFDEYQPFENIKDAKLHMLISIWQMSYESLCEYLDIDPVTGE